MLYNINNNHNLKYLVLQNYINLFLKVYKNIQMFKIKQFKIQLHKQFLKQQIEWNKLILINGIDYFNNKYKFKDNKSKMLIVYKFMLNFKILKELIYNIQMYKYKFLNYQDLW